MRATGAVAMVQGVCTIKVTGIDCGLPRAPFPLIVIMPLYVPGMSDFSSVAVTLTVADWCETRVPAAGFAASHWPPTAVDAVICQLSVPPPVFVIFTA